MSDHKVQITGGTFFLALWVFLLSNSAYLAVGYLSRIAAALEIIAARG